MLHLSCLRECLRCLEQICCNGGGSNKADQLERFQRQAAHLIIEKPLFARVNHSKLLDEADLPTLYRNHGEIVHSQYWNTSCLQGKSQATWKKVNMPKPSALTSNRISPTAHTSSVLIEPLNCSPHTHFIAFASRSTSLREKSPNIFSKKKCRQQACGTYKPTSGHAYHQSTTLHFAPHWSDVTDSDGNPASQSAPSPDHFNLYIQKKTQRNNNKKR